MPKQRSQVTTDTVLPPGQLNTYNENTSNLAPNAPTLPQQSQIVDSIDAPTQVEMVYDNAQVSSQQQQGYFSQPQYQQVPQYSQQNPIINNNIVLQPSQLPTKYVTQQQTVPQQVVVVQKEETGNSTAQTCACLAAMCMMLSCCLMMHH